MRGREIELSLPLPAERSQTTSPTWPFCYWPSIGQPPIYVGTDHPQKSQICLCGTLLSWLCALWPSIMGNGTILHTDRMDGRMLKLGYWFQCCALPRCFGGVRATILSLCLTEATSGLFSQNPDGWISFRWCRGCFGALLCRG